MCVPVGSAHISFFHKLPNEKERDFISPNTDLLLLLLLQLLDATAESYVRPSKQQSTLHNLLSPSR